MEKLREMLKNTGEYNVESKLNYLLYKVITNKLDKEDLEVLKEVNKAFSDAGEEGVNFEDYLLYTKFNIYTGQTSVFNNLIDQIEIQLNKNLMLPENDIFSIYKGVSILESLADRKPIALENIMNILRMIKEDDLDLSSILEDLSSNFADNIHLREDNLYLLQNFEEMERMIKNKDDKDRFWSSTLSRLILRREDKPTLNPGIIRYVENNVGKISKEEEKLGIYYGLSLAYLEQAKFENEKENMEKSYYYENKLKESLPIRTSQISKLYRDILLVQYTAIKGEDTSSILNRINERLKYVLRSNKKEDIDTSMLIISKGLVQILKFSDNNKKFLKIIKEAIPNCSDIVKIWILIDLYAKLRINKKDETGSILNEILELAENLKEEKHEVIEDWLVNALADSYTSNPDEEILGILDQLSEISDLHKEELIANFYSGLSYFAESKKHILNFSS